jgi:outer membrane lipoprotein carrier protein
MARMPDPRKSSLLLSSMLSRLTLAVIWLIVACGTVHAGKALERLQRFTDDLRSFQAQFVQTRYDDNDEPIRKSRGEAYLHRPGLFRWSYTEPYKQVIVGDGENLWIYDADLQQVTVKEMQRALATAPITLLTGTAPLSEQFEIIDRGQREGLLWVELRPKVKDTDFRRIFLGLGEDTLQVMELRDRFDQVTQIKFAEAKMNPDIQASRFEFTPPEGVDVLGRKNDDG